MYHGYPYTDFHELNLDWFLAKFKSLLAEWDAMNIKFDDLDAAVKALREYVENYFDNLDVQEEINNKLDEMLESGELGQIITEYTKVLYEADRFVTQAYLKSVMNLPKEYGWIQGGCYAEPYLVVACVQSFNDVTLLVYNQNRVLLNTIQGLQLGHANSVCSDGTNIYIPECFTGDNNIRSNKLYSIAIADLLDPTPAINEIELDFYFDVVGYNTKTEEFLFDYFADQDITTYKFNMLGVTDKEFNLKSTHKVAGFPDGDNINMTSIINIDDFILIAWQNFDKTGGIYGASTIIIYDIYYRPIRTLPISADYPFENEFIAYYDNKLLVGQVESQYYILYEMDIFADVTLYPDAFRGYRYINKNYLFNANFLKRSIDAHFNAKKITSLTVNNENKFFIDGWLLYGAGTATLEEDGIKIVAGDRSCGIVQLIPTSSQISGQDINFNVEFDTAYDDPNLILGLGPWGISWQNWAIDTRYNGYSNWITVFPNINTAANETERRYFNARIMAEAGQTIKIKSAKIERGRFSTLPYDKYSGGNDDYYKHPYYVLTLLDAWQSQAYNNIGTGYISNNQLNIDISDILGGDKFIFDIATDVTNARVINTADNSTIQGSIDLTNASFSYAGGRRILRMALTHENVEHVALQSVTAGKYFKVITQPMFS